MTKPIVDCELVYSDVHLEIGFSGYVIPKNHPNHREGHQISNNNTPARTSTIISIDRTIEQFETKNTIYRYGSNNV